VANDIVILELIGKHIAKVALEYREKKNMFTLELQRELLKVFDQITANDEIKVVVVHGYEQYFCVGGSKEAIEEVAEKGFDEVFPAYRLFSDFELPVIVAMQGHALGGGLAIACFGDVLLMAEEAKYSANFMSYGFTPGVGATYILPLKLGVTIAQEMMLTARYYSGAELKRRGVQTIVLPQEQLLKEAINIAKELALLPKTALVLLKANYSDKIKAELPEAVKKEKKMHDQTFHTEASKRLIDLHFKEDK